ncbi:MAG TPA: hypothetical protein VMA09_03840 [Candidatus Binataceae bacterium]|nr:hypothetical protein [Candidatus Binataceae bacterium]
MRMLVPPISYRREIDHGLSEFFRTHRVASFRRAIAALCRYYGVKRPRVEWFEYIDWGKTAGRTYEDGRIHLVHPMRWKRGRIYYTERLWVQMIYHEMGHFLLWTDAERKADMFARRMITGLRARARRAKRTAARSTAASRRVSEKRIAARKAAPRRAASTRSAARRATALAGARRRLSVASLRRARNTKPRRRARGIS